MATFPYVALSATLLGLIASLYIHRKKRAKKKLVCPLKANCEKVIHSTHATTLGIPNELLGMAYYIIIGLLYGLMLVAPSMFMVPLVTGIIGVMVLCGILFSIYLIVIQFTVLHAWCSWCLLSAFANVLLIICVIALHFFG